MSDTELSHCEQSVFGSMLTNELSPASLEKSVQKDVGSRKSELTAVAFRKTENIFSHLKITQIFNGDAAF